MVRLERLDVVRGLAVLLMVLDHTLHVGLNHWGWWSELTWVRGTVCRLALPLFMMVSGYLWWMRGRLSGRSVLRVLGAWVLCVPSLVICGFSTFDILALFVAVGAVSPLVIRYPLAVVVGGFLAAWNYPMLGVGWYHWGYVAGWLALGVLVAPSCAWPVPLLGGGVSGRGWEGLAWLGRRSLQGYVVHWTVLGALVLLVGSH